MKASQSFHFFPPLRLGTMRAWTNITAGNQPIETWASGAIVLRRSIDFDSVLSMAAKYELKGELLATRERSIEHTEQLFCLEGSNHGAEIAKAAFLIRAGKVCGFEMTATATLDRLLVSVFQEHLESVKVKIRAWKTSGNEQIATIAQK
jgi:hypothetical protein